MTTNNYFNKSFTSVFHSTNQTDTVTQNQAIPSMLSASTQLLKGQTTQRRFFKVHSYEL